jgi:hypothetical protein
MNSPVFPQRAWLNAEGGHRVFLCDLKKVRLDLGMNLDRSRWHLWDFPIDMRNNPEHYNVTFGSLIATIDCVNRMSDSVSLVTVAYSNGCQLICNKVKDSWFWKVHETELPNDPAGIVNIKGRPMVACLENILDGVTSLWKVVNDEVAG